MVCRREIEKMRGGGGKCATRGRKMRGQKMCCAGKKSEGEVGVLHEKKVHDIKYVCFRAKSGRRRDRLSLPHYHHYHHHHHHHHHHHQRSILPHYHHHQHFLLT